MLKSIKALLAIVVAIAALGGVASQAQAATSFGADVNQNVQPSNSTPAHACYMNDKLSLIHI